MSRNMNVVVPFFLLGIVTLTLNCVVEKETPPEELPKARSWHEGGTLHGASVDDWWKAPVWNRVATSADFAAVAAKNQGRLSDR